MQDNARHFAITGASGLVGSELVTGCVFDDVTVHSLVRKPLDADREHATDIHWQPTAGLVERERLEGMDAVIHLAGEPVAAGRWTQQKKQRIRDSRVLGTKTLCHALASLQRKPSVLLCASASGYYGDRGEQWLTEDAPSGKGFLAEVCREWEAAADPAREAGIRVVHVRIGIVLSSRGGALHAMLLPFKFGLGGRLGSGRQYVSWITLDDMIRAIEHLLKTDSVHGPVNMASPNPVTNLQFTKALGRVLHRPTIMPLPAFAARLALGEMADELLLAGTRLQPKRLLESGFVFVHDEIEDALRAVVKGRR